jgi:hypothetical protein
VPTSSRIRAGACQCRNATMPLPYRSCGFRCLVVRRLGTAACPREAARLGLCRRKALAKVAGKIRPSGDHGPRSLGHELRTWNTDDLSGPRYAAQIDAAAPFADQCPRSLDASFEAVQQTAVIVVVARRYCSGLAEPRRAFAKRYNETTRQKFRALGAGS